MRPNPNVKNPCPSCQGWAFFMVSRDPDRDADCTVCDNGERRKEGVMSEYTPTTEEVAAQYRASAQTRPLGVTYTEALMARRAEFDRWLASVKAGAWSEGHSQAVANLAWPDERKSNPYRSEQS